ncbi:MAG: UDP-N-acetylenolpyruvoylglucosamine reductase [Elusimicrobia bacterium RIFOXYA2_FULL_40_6]|nr:MAG: UDP-N-acetylenolpyruvoylglucosamine reductase [Elusimicrobia bacterium RIFOXYA2_FULL_40_6]
MIKILKNISLKKHTNFKIGGKARYFVSARAKNDFSETIAWAKKHKVRYMIIGLGTNLLFTEKGFNGLIIKNSWHNIQMDGKQTVFSSSGTDMSKLVNYYLKNNYSGLEWAGGLPGTIGGAVRGNAGAFLGEIKDSVVKVESIDYSRAKPRTIIRSNKQCRFYYRDSIFKHNKEIILGVWFKAKKGDKKEISKKIKDCRAYREKFQPLEYPSAGSFFKNIPLKSVATKVKKEFSLVIKNDPFPLIPAAAVTDKLGLKGTSIGGAQASNKHPNFLINKNNASFSDIISLSNLIRKKAYQKFKIKMIPEVQIVE